MCTTQGKIKTESSSVKDEREGRGSVGAWLATLIFQPLLEAAKKQLIWQSLTVIIALFKRSISIQSEKHALPFLSD